MASASRIRPTVRRLIGRRKATAARTARSVSDCRLKGSLVWATVSQARALTIALSRGGKRGLAPASGLVFQGQVALAPTPAPVAHRVRMQLDMASRLDVGERGVLVEQKDQGRPLPYRALAHDRSGLLQEVRGKTGSEGGLGTGHETHLVGGH